jgi:hypothetical protein
MATQEVNICLSSVPSGMEVIDQNDLFCATIVYKGLPLRVPTGIGADSLNILRNAAVGDQIRVTFDTTTQNVISIRSAV